MGKLSQCPSLFPRLKLSGSSEFLVHRRLEERQQETSTGWRLNFEDRSVRSRGGTTRHSQSQTVTEMVEHK